MEGARYRGGRVRRPASGLLSVARGSRLADGLMVLLSVMNSAWIYVPSMWCKYSSLMVLMLPVQLYYVVFTLDTSYPAAAQVLTGNLLIFCVQFTDYSPLRDDSNALFGMNLSCVVSDWVCSVCSSLSVCRCVAGLCTVPLHRWWNGIRSGLLPAGEVEWQVRARRHGAPWLPHYDLSRGPASRIVVYK